MCNCGDIKKELIACMLNAVNEHLAHAAGVERAIAKAAGPEFVMKSKESAVCLQTISTRSKYNGYFKQNIVSNADKVQDEPLPKSYKEPTVSETDPSTDKGPSKESTKGDLELVNTIELPSSLKKEFDALQMIVPTLNIRLSESGEILIRYFDEKQFMLRNICTLISKIPRDSKRISNSLNVSKADLDKFIHEEQTSKTCLVRYHRYMDQEPLYVFCWIHRHLVIILSYGNATNTSCDALLKWIPCGLEKKDGTSEKEYTIGWFNEDKQKPFDATCKEFLHVEANYKEITEIPRHVYKKMEIRNIASVCVPLTGSETILIKRFVEYFSRKAKKGRIQERLFLELCIPTELKMDEKLCNMKDCIEKFMDKKMFQTVKLSGININDLSQDQAIPISIEISTDSIENVAKKVDVFVNSSNPDLAMDRGFISTQILRLGGKAIQDECNEIKKRGKLSYGDICKTSSGRLSCRKIYHVALYSEWVPVCKISLRILTSLMLICLKEMEKDNYTSIAFPALGTGRLGYPYFQVAMKMFNVVRAYGRENPDTKIEKVLFLVHDQDTICKHTFGHVMEAHRQYIKLEEDDFIKKTYKEIWIPARRLTVQIWPEKALLGTPSVKIVEAYFVFVQNAAVKGFGYQCRLSVNLISVGSQSELDEGIAVLKDTVNKHRFTSVLVDIKDIALLDTYSTVVEWFVNLPFVESLQLVVSTEVFNNLNPEKKLEKKDHKLSELVLCVWGSRYKEVMEDLQRIIHG
ncbi:uncharacterized protein LOC133205077 [Saccostrea echinata]|uniref:uncharacterized protein LOC133205077 n=1 Tax=Saccostrea echinata TaxID=191078 RepID=UPI002A80C7CD|nr:uncharacterized protein LOC133205077 [Saccostrea echinata]